MSYDSGPAVTYDTVASVSNAATITNGAAGSTFEYTLTSGALPDGLTLDANSGTISGTPTAGGAATTVTVTATSDADPVVVFTYTIVITVTGKCTFASVISGTSTAVAAAVDYVVTVTSSGAAVTSTISITTTAKISVRLREVH